jgi:hypothetical protein
MDLSVLQGITDVSGIVVPRDMVLVRAINDESDGWVIKDGDGNEVKLMKDMLYSVMTADYIPDEIRNICFKCEIVQVPRRVSEGRTPISVDIVAGDICYVHHSMCDPDNRVEIGGEYYYMLPYKVDYNLFSVTNFYLKLCNNRLEAIDRWLLVEPIEEEYLKSSSIVLLDTKKKSDKYYRVKSVKPNEDVQVGEVIITKPNCVKKRSINGKVEYMVYMEHVYGKRIV